MTQGGRTDTTPTPNVILSVSEGSLKSEQRPCGKQMLLIETTLAAPRIDVALRQEMLPHAKRFFALRLAQNDARGGGAAPNPTDYTIVNDAGMKGHRQTSNQRHPERQRRIS